ncbi:MAG: hypothetical protein WDO24_09955 [Pseudomonadota bacterium]
MIKDAQLTGPAAVRVPKLDRLMFFDWLKLVPQMPDLVERWNREIGG